MDIYKSTLTYDEYDMLCLVKETLKYYSEHDFFKDTIPDNDLKQSLPRVFDKLHTMMQSALNSKHGVIKAVRIK